MIYGYARVSSTGQAVYGVGLDVQEEELRTAGATEIYSDVYTGTQQHRPELDKLLAKLRAGDTLVVTKLDRIARNARHGLTIIESLIDKDVSIRIMNMGMFDNTPSGKLMLTMMFAFAEFERDMIVQRTQEGKSFKRQNDPEYKEGRKTIELDVEELYALRDEGHTINEIAKLKGVSVSTIKRRLA
jgi:DNA invertase Pin-like site-specific DNA recombinase